MDNLPIRKLIRLLQYDYSRNGAYFVTFCTHKHQKMLSTICRGDPCGRPQIQLTELGQICSQMFQKIESIHDIAITDFVIMPNHIHAIVVILFDNVSERATARVAPTLGAVIGGYKSIVANEWLKICEKRNTYMGEIWQRSYYDRIIRNHDEHARIRQYIHDNPINWAVDEYNKGDPPCQT